MKDADVEVNDLEKFEFALRISICTIPTAYARTIVRRCIIHGFTGHLIG